MKHNRNITVNFCSHAIILCNWFLSINAAAFVFHCFFYFVQVAEWVSLLQYTIHTSVSRRVLLYQLLTPQSSPYYCFPLSKIYCKSMRLGFIVGIESISFVHPIFERYSEVYGAEKRADNKENPSFVSVEDDRIKHICRFGFRPFRKMSSSPSPSSSYYIVLFVCAPLRKMAFSSTYL